MQTLSKNVNNDSSQWTIQYFEGATEEQKKNWKLGIPQFKYCKKRKEFFSENFAPIWYKSPYKYHMLLKAENLGDSNVMAYLDLTYEDGQKVNVKGEAISKTEDYFKTTKDNSLEVKLGSFQFNVCSYKHDGRKFRIVVYLYIPDAENPVCGMISPSFVIKAKKPISKPGIKSKKRNLQKMLNEQRKQQEQQFSKRRKIMTNSPTSTPNNTSFDFLNSTNYPMFNNPMIQGGMQYNAFEALEQLRGYDYDSSFFACDGNYKYDFFNPMEGNFVDFTNNNNNNTSGNYPIIPQVQHQYPRQQEEFIENYQQNYQQNGQGSLQRVTKVLNTFETMEDQERKQVLTKLFEQCPVPEKELINQRYFQDISMNSLFPDVASSTLPTSNENQQQQQVGGVVTINSVSQYLL